MRPWAALTVQFQPTLPMRGATVIAFEGEVMSEISTHAPHAGSDSDFVIRIYGPCVFQPTLPMRGATQEDQDNLPS